MCLTRALAVIVQKWLYEEDQVGRLVVAKIGSTSAWVNPMNGRPVRC